MQAVNNKIIAKNTVFLYFRMLLLMAVSLYTTRVTLAILGVDDYGIYQLIGGFISLFSIISSSLVAAVQRYFNIALGKDDTILFSKIYSTSLVLLIILSVFILLIGETIGLWFVNTQLNIPSGRESATIWVYQLSLITLIISLFRAPDNAAIIAHERMSFYAFLSIGEAVFKLGIVYLLSLFGSDKLITYTFLYLCVTLIINVLYKVYCNKHFIYCRFRLKWEKNLTKEMVSFSWWTLMGKGVQLGTIQGENFFLNHYHSVTVNAARGVASQVYNAINVFLYNFQTAFRPQLVQTYVSEDKTEHHKLLYRAARLSFFLLLVITVPVLFNLDALLSIWLEEVPPYTKEFCVYVLFAYLVDALSTPLSTSISANGNIKKTQITLSSIFIVQLVCSFVALKYGAVPYIVSIFILCSHTLMFLTYLYNAHKLCSVSYSIFAKEVIAPCSLVLVVCLLIPFFLSLLTGSLFVSIILIISDFIWSVLVVWCLGLSKSEKDMVLSFVNHRIRKEFKNKS